MGDPRRIRRKYMRPGHPWQKERIEYEKQLKYNYGLKNKSEIWKVNTKLKNFANTAKRLIAARGTQADREQAQLLAKLHSLGLVSESAHLDDVLSLQLENLLDRRLQTVLVKKGLACTPKQARQFITHRHIKVGDKVITSPGHLIRVSEEHNITFIKRSPLSNDEHPERQAAHLKTVAAQKAAEAAAAPADDEEKADEKPKKKAVKKDAKKKAPKKESSQKPATEEKPAEDTE